MDTLSAGPTLPSGARMPLVGLGTWQARGTEAYDSVLTALSVGYRHLDTATMYGNEDQVGRAIADSGVDRDEVFLTTKLPAEGAGRAREVLQESLSALGTDHVDLWLIHWPPGDQASPQVWQSLRDARDAGLARDIGVSNYSTAQIDELVQATGEMPAVNQIRWALPLFDPARLAELRERGVVLEGYSPFRRGDLADPVLVEVARAHDVSTAQVVVRWHVQHQTVVIPKSAQPDRIRSNADVLGFTLTDAEMARLDALSTV